MRRAVFHFAVILVLVVLVAAACGGGDEGSAATLTIPLATPTPRATETPTTAVVSTPATAVDLVAQGRELYLAVPPNSAPQALWCYQCHIVEGLPTAAGLVGPDHTNIGASAATRKPGMSAEAYLRESIVDPEAHVAEGVERATRGLMTKAIVQGLTDAQVDALVAFLLTLQ